MLESLTAKDDSTREIVIANPSFAEAIYVEGFVKEIALLAEKPFLNDDNTDRKP